MKIYEGKRRIYGGAGRNSLSNVASMHVKLYPIKIRPHPHQILKRFFYSFSFNNFWIIFLEAFIIIYFLGFVF